jgi:hypothetical protein
MPSATHPCLPKTKGGVFQEGIDKEGQWEVIHLENRGGIDSHRLRQPEGCLPRKGGVGSVSSQVGSGDGNPSGDHQSRPEVRP